MTRAIVVAVVGPGDNPDRRRSPPPPRFPRGPSPVRGPERGNPGGRPPRTGRLPCQPRGKFPCHITRWWSLERLLYVTDLAAITVLAGVYMAATTLFSSPFFSLSPENWRSSSTFLEF